jgi:hypothetical protein
MFVKAMQKYSPVNLFPQKSVNVFILVFYFGRIGIIILFEKVLLFYAFLQKMVCRRAGEMTKICKQKYGFETKNRNFGIAQGENMYKRA